MPNLVHIHFINQFRRVALLNNKLDSLVLSAWWNPGEEFPNKYTAQTKLRWRNTWVLWQIEMGKIREDLE